MTTKATKTRQRKTLETTGIAGVCDMLREGLSYAKIGKKLGMAGTCVWKWINADEERMAAARDALQSSADASDEAAERVLMALKKTSTQAEIAKARELAHHYRWRAAKRNPRVYGERQQLDVHDLDKPLSEEEVDKKLAAIAARAAAKPASDP